jgi:hypothetical protein
MFQIWFLDESRGHTEWCLRRTSNSSLYLGIPVISVGDLVAWNNMTTRKHKNSKIIQNGILMIKTWLASNTGLERTAALHMIFLDFILQENCHTVLKLEPHDGMSF